MVKSQASPIRPRACGQRQPACRARHQTTGMMTRDERRALFSKLLPYRGRIVVYHCTSSYPCPFDELYLMEVEKIVREGTWKAVGFSNHGYGIAADIAAITLGATWVERHFIDDRAFPHTDSAASLEVDGLRRLCRDVKNVRKALQHKKIDLTEFKGK